MWFSEGVAEFRPKNYCNQLFLKNEEDVWLATRFVFCLLKVILKKTLRGWVSQLGVVSYLFWYDPFYHGNFKFKAKLGLDAVLSVIIQILKWVM